METEKWRRRRWGWVPNGSSRTMPAMIKLLPRSTTFLLKAPFLYGTRGWSHIGPGNTYPNHLCTQDNCQIKEQKQKKNPSRPQRSTMERLRNPDLRIKRFFDEVHNQLPHPLWLMAPGSLLPRASTFSVFPVGSIWTKHSGYVFTNVNSISLGTEGRHAK